MSTATLEKPKSSARLYRENTLPFFVPMGVKIPVAVSAFPDEVYQSRGVGRKGRIPT